MAMRAAATTTAATVAATSGRGLRAMFSSLSSFPFNIPQTNVEKPPPAEPSTNLFISGTRPFFSPNNLHFFNLFFTSFGVCNDLSILSCACNPFKFIILFLWFNRELFERIKNFKLWHIFLFIFQISNLVYSKT